MRVTGGKYVRRNVACPPGEIRPAMDRMRCSLFSILGDLSGLSFLDLFSGSGLMAIEAASRGASVIHMVEKDAGKRETIERNLAFVEEKKKLFIADAERFLCSSSYGYDIVYLDPPFAFPDKPRLLKEAAAGSAVGSGGLFIIHFPFEEERKWPEAEGDFSLSDRRKYGRSIVRMYKRS